MRIMYVMYTLDIYVLLRASSETKLNVQLL